MTSPEHVKKVKTTLNPAQQRSARLKNNCGVTANTPAAIAACKQIIHIGIFFDGTDNHMERDSKNGKKAYTNVVSLFKAYKEDTNKGYYKFYVQGVGTPFSDIGEHTEDPDGKSSGWGGGRRIYFAIFQILNIINQKVNGSTLFPKSTIRRAVSHPDIKNGSRFELATGALYALTSIALFGKSKIIRPPIKLQLTPKEIMAPYITKLNNKITGSNKPVIEEINISIFGFSRGAAQARAFVNVFHQVVGESGKIGNIKTTFNFLGLFDTVASVLLPYSSPGAGGKLGAEGLLSWADETMKIHPNVKRCVHFVAGHEFRTSFPLSSIMYDDAYKENYKEVVYPGVHCDVGGGYAPGDQGKSINIGKITRAKKRAKIEKDYDVLMIKMKKAAEDSTKRFKKMRKMYSDIYEKAIEKHGYHVGPLEYPKKYNHVAEAKEQITLKDLYHKTWDEKLDALKKFDKEYRIPNYNEGREYLLSQIPLRHMFEEAYDHVLPLMSYDEMKNKDLLVHDDFLVSPTVETLLNNYISIFEKKIHNNSTHKKPNLNTLQNLFYRSQELYLSWRWSILKPMGILSTKDLQSLPFYLDVAEGADEDLWRKKYKDAVMKLKSYALANAQEKWDKVEANKDYLIDMWEVVKNNQPKPSPSSSTSVAQHSQALRPYFCRKSYLGMTEVIDNIAHDVLEIQGSKGEIDQQLHQLFDEYMHDSHAGFYIAGPRSDYEREEFYKKAIKKSEPSKFDKELIKNGWKNFPLMTDKKVSDLYLGGIKTLFQQSMGRTTCRPNTRREAGGHVKARRLMDSNRG